MIKQLFGSFFRTFGRIIAYLVFGALLALIFQYKDVFAADFSYADTDYSIYYDNYLPGVSDDGSYRFKYSDFTEWSGWTDKNVAVGSYDNVTGEQTLLGRIGFRWYGNNTNYFKKNNLYNIQIELRFGTSDARQLFYENYVLFYSRANTTNSQEGNSLKYLNSNITYTMTLDPDSNGTIFIDIKFMPNTDVKFVRFDFVNKNLNPIDNTSLSTRKDTLVYGRIRYYDSKITYTEDTGALIENQTDVIKQQTDKLNNSLNNMMEIFQKSSEDTNDIYLNETENPDGTCNGILCNLKKVVKAVINFPVTLVTAIIDGVKTLLIPENFDFLDDFRDSIESKLGFVAEVPMAMIEFLFLLGNYDVDEMDSIDFPEIDIFGYKFWNAQEIDLTEAINIFKPFKYITDVLCVIICINTLTKWRERFTGGGS